jgi:hypothetical protein
MRGVIMKVQAHKTEQIEIDMSYQELAWAIMGVVEEKIDHIDDAGCDWEVHGDKTYIGEGQQWEVSDDPEVARLVEAANIIRKM